MKALLLAAIASLTQALTTDSRIIKGAIDRKSYLTLTQIIGKGSSLEF